MNVFLARKYLVLLIALAVLVAVYPMLRGALDARLLFATLLTVVFLCAMLVLFTERRHRIVAVLLVKRASTFPPDRGASTSVDCENGAVKSGTVGRSPSRPR